MIGEERQCLAFLLAGKEIHFAFSLAKHIKRRNLFVANSDNNYLNKLRQKKCDKLCNHVINFNEFASKNFYHLNKLFLCAFQAL